MNDSEITELLKSAKTIAVVGLSSNPMRPSFGVSRFLQGQGFRIIPVNPQETEVLGERSYGSLSDVTESVDIVNIFRRPARVPEVVDEAIQKGARCVWMQEGVVSAEGAAKAEAAGIPVVMDRCILKELARLLPSSR
jgi:predicted CoA-binding protein